MGVCRGLVRDGDVQAGVRGRDCDCGARAVRRRQLVGIRRMQRVLHGGVRMGLQRGDVHGDLRRRDAQGGRGVRRREHGVGRWMQLRVQCGVGVCMWRGAGMWGGLATAARQDAGVANGRILRRRSATMATLWEATDAAHHARSSAAGSVQGGTQTARTRALQPDVGTRHGQGRRSATTGIRRTATGAHHRA